MTSQEATAELVWKAFQGLSKQAQERFLARLWADPKLREDLIDRAMIAERRSERSRPLSEVIAERRAARAR